VLQKIDVEQERMPGSARPRTLVIVPAYNEEGSIGGVIDDLRAELPDADVLVVDDGSSDRTADEARRRSRPGHTVMVARLSANLGIGGAVQTGLRYALRHGYDRAVQVDGDGQHPASSARAVLQRLDQGADLIVGSRFAGGVQGFASTPTRRAGIAMISWALRLLGGPAVLDTTSGLRAFSRRAIGVLARRYPSDFPEPESLLIAHRAGQRIEEVPVPMAPRSHGASSITRLGSAFYMARVLLGLALFRVTGMKTASIEESAP
jgi:glycosyltransferase involved in cell wall biosynthesis